MADTFDHHMLNSDCLDRSDALKLIPLLKEHKLDKTLRDVNEADLKVRFTQLPDSKIKPLVKALNQFREKQKSSKTAEGLFKRSTGDSSPTEEARPFNEIEIMNNVQNA